jgi:arginase
MQIIRVRLINSMGKTNGCEKAPVEVMKALRKIGSSETGKEIDVDGLNLEEIHVDLDNLEEANYLIFKNAKEAFERNKKVFFIGGDHSISYPLVKAFGKVEDNPLLIVFDAHADCIEPGKEPTHEEWLRGLVEQGFPGDKIILISARNFYDNELEFINKHKITLISMGVLQEDLQGVCDLVMERARSANGFYVSIDIDAVDPAHAPGVAYAEPGGMSSRDLIYFMKRLNLLDNFRGADIVEINPDKDFNEITVKLGAKLLAEML